MHPRCSRPATSWVLHTTSCNTQSSAPEDGRNHRSKHVELIGIINKPLLLHLVGCLYYLYQWCTVKQISNITCYHIHKRNANLSFYFGEINYKTYFYFAKWSCWSFIWIKYYTHWQILGGTLSENTKKKFRWSNGTVVHRCAAFMKGLECSF
jgi:hypothetical protein